MVTMDFWYEFGSTYSYPATMRIEPLADKAAVVVRWRPFLLGPIFKTHGWSDSPFNIFAAKGRYMWRDLQRICEAERLPLKLPPIRFPQNGLKAARLALVREEKGWTPAFTRMVFTANYAEQKDISDEATLYAILGALGVDAESSQRPVRRRLRKRCARKTNGRWLVGCSARRHSRWAMNCFGGTTGLRKR